jgi:Ni,Fe-hydrogenase III small subunit
MLDLFRARLRQGMRTSSFPDGGADFPERFRGLPVLDPDPRERLESHDPASPAFVHHSDGGRLLLDVGACLFSPEDAVDCGAAGAVVFSRDHRMATCTREGLVSGTGEVELARALDARMLKLFGRSLRLRSVVTGSCGGCEAELTALGNVVFDMSRFGIQFVASPRHADGIVITGALNRNMRVGLRKTIEATPAPRLIIAVGACAISGGPFRGSPEVSDVDVAGIHVDLYVPGCPPHPLTMLDGLLRLLDRLSPEVVGGSSA